MKVFVVLVMLLLLLLPGGVNAADVLGCDGFLAQGNVLAWAACVVVGWVMFNEQSDLEYMYGFLG